MKKRMRINPGSCPAGHRVHGWHSSRRCLHQGAEACDRAHPVTLFGMSWNKIPRIKTLKVDHPKVVAWRWGRKIEKLYHSLCPGTLCLILLPGTKS
ncbi:RNA exonuclease 5 [Manis javanica]|nr:RNA exonuclease 5 [Manis javanica]